MRKSDRLGGAVELDLEVRAIIAGAVLASSNARLRPGQNLGPAPKVKSFGALDSSLCSQRSWRGGWRPPEPSADPLRQLDDDPLRAADVAEPIDVFVALHLANELRAAGSQASDNSIDVVD